MKFSLSFTLDTLPLGYSPSETIAKILTDVAARVSDNQATQGQIRNHGGRQIGSFDIDEVEAGRKVHGTEAD